MKIRKQFKAGLYLQGRTLKDIADEIGTSVVYLKKIIHYMENDPDSIPDTDLGAAIVGKVNDVVNSLSMEISCKPQRAEYRSRPFQYTRATKAARQCPARTQKPTR